MLQCVDLLFSMCYYTHPHFYGTSLIIKNIFDIINLIYNVILFIGYYWKQNPLRSLNEPSPNPLRTNIHAKLIA